MGFPPIFSPESYFLNPYAIPVLVSSLVILSMGFFVIKKAKGDSKSYRFFLMILSVFIWLFFASLTYFSRTSDVALFWYKYFAYSAVLLIAPAIFYFSLAWSKELEARMIRISHFFILLLSFFALVNIFTDSVISGARSHFYGYYVVFDAIGIFSFIIWCVPMMLSMAVFYISRKREKSSDGKKQLNLVFFGYVLAYTGIIDFFPAIFPDAAIYNSGYISVLLFSSIVFYAIVRYRLLDIETAVHKTAAWAAVSAVTFIPILFFTYLLRDYFNYLSPWQFSAIILVLFISFISYFNFIQPRIDYFFRRKVYDLGARSAQLLTDLSGILDPAIFSKKLSTGLKEIFFPKDAAVFLREGKGFVSESPRRRHVSDQFLESVLERDRAVQREDFIGDSKYSSGGENSLKWLDANQFAILVPIKVGSNLLGFFALGKKENLMKYSSDEIATLKKIGAEAAIQLYNVFEHIKLSEKETETRKKLQRFSRELERKVRERTEDIVERDREITNINRRLEAANTELKELDTKKDEFISVGAHELKTPLTSIKGFAQLLQDERVLEDKEKRAHYLDLINKNTDKLYLLILDLVDSSKISVGKLRVIEEDIDVDTAFEDIRENMEMLIRQKGLEPRFSKEDGLPKIRADPNRMLQVLRNLIMNAVNHTEKGSISLHIARRKDFLEFSVSDTGEGIPSESQKHIFSRFYQVDSSMTRKVGGSGLGLSISKGLIELMGGKIWFDSVSGKGTTFYFTLPTSTRGKGG